MGTSRAAVTPYGDSLEEHPLTDTEQLPGPQLPSSFHFNRFALIKIELNAICASM